MAYRCIEAFMEKERSLHMASDTALFNGQWGKVKVKAMWVAPAEEQLREEEPDVVGLSGSRVWGSQDWRQWIHNCPMAGCELVMMYIQAHTDESSEVHQMITQTGEKETVISNVDLSLPTVYQEVGGGITLKAKQETCCVQQLLNKVGGFLSLTIYSAKNGTVFNYPETTIQE